MAVACERYEAHLASFDVNLLEQHLRYYEAQVAELPQDDDRREIAQKNLAILLQRKDRFAELIRNLQAARRQMQLMENTFRLLPADIVTMHNEKDLGERLDDLRTG